MNLSGITKHQMIKKKEMLLFLQMGLETLESTHVVVVVVDVRVSVEVLYLVLHGDFELN